MDIPGMPNDFNSLNAALREENSKFHRTFSIKEQSREQDLQNMHRTLTPLFNQYNGLAASISWLCELLERSIGNDVRVIVLLDVQQKRHAGITVIDTSSLQVLDTCIARKSDHAFMLSVVRWFDKDWCFSST